MNRPRVSLDTRGGFKTIIGYFWHKGHGIGHNENNRSNKMEIGVLRNLIKENRNKMVYSLYGKNGRKRYIQSRC